MKKKEHQLAIASALSKALEPPPAPKRKPSATLNTLLSQYAPPPVPAEKEEVPQISPGVQAGPAIMAGPDIQAGPAKHPLQALPEAGHDIQAGPAIETQHEVPAPDLLSSLPSVAGYLKLSNQIIDHLMPQLEPYEQIVYLQLYRLSHGNGKPFCLISMPKLARRTKISERSLWRTVIELDKRGLVKKNPSVHGKGKEQGVSYWVAAPAGPATEASRARQAGHDTQADNKRKAFKEKDIKSDTPKTTRLTPEEKRETIQMIADLITKNGYSFEQAKIQFGGNLTPEDWVMVRAQVEGQVSQGQK